MKITRYTQSCMLVEVDDTRLLIDPGTDAAKTHESSVFGTPTAVLYTHEHGDHFDEMLFSHFANQAIPCYGNESMLELVGEIQLVKDGHELQIGSVTIKALQLDHCLMPNGAPGPQNTGYLINGQFFHPGDGVYLEGLQVELLALPITGPDISMKDAFSFANQLQAKRVIPIHYEKLGADPEVFAMFAERLQEPFEVLVIADGASVEI